MNYYYTIVVAVIGIIVVVALYILLQMKRKESFTARAERITGMDASEYHFDVETEEEPTKGLLLTVGKVSQDELDEIKTTIEKITKLKVIELVNPEKLDNIITTEAILDISDNINNLSYLVRMDTKKRKIYTFTNIGKKLSGSTQFADTYVSKMYADKFLL
jgi:D-Tyr-tRNAtyr deacylase